jgi:DNA polymerase elongation subunit (family B)
VTRCQCARARCRVASATAGAAQGIEIVRRDNCALVRNVITTCLEMILIARDEEGAKAYVRATIADLLMNRLDLSLLVITKARAAPRAGPACVTRVGA